MLQHRRRRRDKDQFRARARKLLETDDYQGEGRPGRRVSDHRREANSRILSARCLWNSRCERADCELRNQFAFSCFNESCSAYSCNGCRLKIGSWLYLAEKRGDHAYIDGRHSQASLCWAEFFQKLAMNQRCVARDQCQFARQTTFSFAAGRRQR
jgi:hypothetical protein